MQSKSCLSRGVYPEDFGILSIDGQRVSWLQVTDKAAVALSLKADGEEVNELRLFVKGQLADVRAAAKEGAGRGRLSYTTGAGHTLCLSCDQPLAPLRGHTHEPLAPQGQSACCCSADVASHSVVLVAPWCSAEVSSR